MTNYRSGAPRILAIDPGSRESGWVIIDSETRKPLHKGKTDNAFLLPTLRYDPVVRGCDVAVIEMVASYGMAVGADVFETCVWIGRFYEALTMSLPSAEVELVFRRDVKLHHCQSARAKDANVVQALVDRFAPGEPNRGKGTKAAPGWFHGFAKDVWQAYALAVYVADSRVATGIEAQA